MELDGAAVIAVPKTLTPVTVRDLRRAIDAACSAPAAACVLAGNTEVFCRGLDMHSLDSPDSAEAIEMFAQCLETLRTGSMPTIAYVEGAASGGGVGLAAACDVALATKDATFVLPELVFGLTPAVILPYLAQRINMQKARWLAMTVTALSAQDALGIGLIDAVCLTERAPSILRSWLRTFGRLDRAALQKWKQMTIAPPSPSTREGVRATIQSLNDAQVRQRLRLFHGGEAPWSGKNP